MIKLRVLGIISFLCVCKASADVAADNTAAAVTAELVASESGVNNVVIAADDGKGDKNDTAAKEKIDEAAGSDAATGKMDAATVNGAAAESSTLGEQPAEGEVHHEEVHHDGGQFHELTEAFGIMDENADGVLQKEEILIAIRRSAHHTEIHPEEYADKLLMPKEAVDADGNQTNTFDMDTFSEMIHKASSEETKEGEMPSLNQQLSQLASDVLASYYYQHEEEPPYDPSTEEWYNPHNMTYDELEYHLYEWEEDAVGHVTEYLDWEVFDRMRNQEDDWFKEDEEHVEEEKEKKHTTLKDQKHHDDGSKTKVEMRKSNSNHYLNLSNDVAHVVEFYAPWCPHCQHFKWEYIEIATETKRRATATPGMCLCLPSTLFVFPYFILSNTVFFVTPFSITYIQSSSMPYHVTCTGEFALLMKLTDSLQLLAGRKVIHSKRLALC